MWRVCLAIPLAACGGSKPAATIGNHNGATVFDQAELAVLDHGDLRLYSTEGDRLTEVMKVHLANNVDGSFLAMNPHDFGWADHDHLLAAMGQHVVLVTAAGTKELAVPAEDSMQAPKVASEGNSMQLEPGGVLGLTVADGSAWWSKCAWGFAVDGFQCEQYVHVQLWPGHEQKIDRSGIAPRAKPAWPDESPKGYNASVDGDGKHATCMPPSGQPSSLHSADENDFFGGLQWVSLAPPVLLVQYDQYGLADAIPTRWTLHDGCTETPIETGSYVHLGPNGLWVAEGEKATTLRRGAKVLGQLPSGDVRFR